MQAYLEFAAELEEGDVDVRVVYWLMYHKPSPDSEGGCSFDDLFWKRRDTKFDDCTMEESVVDAAKQVLDCNNIDDCHDRDMLNAVGTIAEHFGSDSDDVQSDYGDGTEVFMEED